MCENMLFGVIIFFALDYFLAKVFSSMSNDTASPLCVWYLLILRVDHLKFLVWRA